MNLFLYCCVSFFFFLQSFVDGAILPGSNTNDSIIPDSNTSDRRVVISFNLSLFMSILMVIAFVMCFYGYKYFRYTMAVVGFLLGVLIVNIIIAAVSTNVKPWIPGVCSVLLGVPLGYAAMRFWKVGVVLIGLVGGVFAGFICFAFIIHYIYNHVALLYVSLIVFGIAGGVVSIYYRRPVLVTITSLIGSFLFHIGVIFYVVYSTPTFDSLDSNSGWYILASFIVLFIAGTCIQFIYTAKDVDYRKDEHSNEYKNNTTPRNTKSTTSNNESKDAIDLV